MIEPNWDALAEAYDNERHREHFGFCLDGCHHEECRRVLDGEETAPDENRCPVCNEGWDAHDEDGGCPLGEPLTDTAKGAAA